ncbi:prolipoprotein diacylglyceryl transferase [Amantichitinum ursilacus]|uniref:prolipoprotein diacylglyceryl transferase n=1 Tax=Amantichitinum ursilacus TaxID=857265 RepID=UPI001F317F70|nr:prolipoprotein diacylglyceryl transferase family protein [Amantichitinum ursilacus]
MLTPYTALAPAAAHVVHTVFETLAMMLGARLYLRLRRAEAADVALLQGRNYAVLAGCLAGAALGNKLAFWFDQPQLWPANGTLLTFMLGGQSIVGGLLGGLLGVEIAKGFSKDRRSTGDHFVYPILLGIMVGRIGCFMAGLNDDTYGLPTRLWWGMDFGDGVARHPTQLYEILFAAGLGLLLWRAQPALARVPGLRFKLMLASYLLWRLLVDGIKPVFHPWALGLSGIQWICVIGLLAYMPVVVRAALQWQREEARACL